MSKIKDRAIIAVISGLTGKQASNMIGALNDVKLKHAPLARGTMASVPLSEIGTALRDGIKLIGGEK